MLSTAKSAGEAKSFPMRLATKPPVDLGAPAQHSQSSRKGKKAWRKHVDIGEVEDGLESMRAEERVSGVPLQKQTNSQLFTVDFTGDAAVRKSIPKSRPLKSTQILAARSAIPAVFSRPGGASVSASPTKPHMSNEEKDRLRRIAKRNRKGPLNSLVDPSQVGEGSAPLEPTEAVKQSGKYDVWDQIESDEEFVNSLKTEDAKDYVAPIVRKKPVKPPKSDSSLAQIGIGAIVEPHQGTSYNPPLQAHQELLLAAHEAEEQREAEAQKYAGIKEKVESARRVVRDGEVEGAIGMILDIPAEDAADDGLSLATDIVPVASKPTKPKTKQQKLKALKLKAEKRLLAEKLRRKVLLHSVSSVKSLKRTVEAALTDRERAMLEKKIAHQHRFRKGLAGSKIGKHVVPKGDIDVQLGEELSESLRGLKPEGNLLKDRFLSFQHRAMLEPRSRVLPKRRKLKVKEYEKHAWKRFV